jgi:hypothetical protein
MAKFAAETDVPVEKTRFELERLLEQYKAQATAVFNSPREAAICFEIDGRRVMFRMPMPDATAKEFTHRQGGFRGEEARTPAGARAAYDKVIRRRWRALLLSIRAKLVSVDEGIETFEEAFMAHVVMPDGMTVGQHVKPRIAAAYKTEKMVPLLPGPKGAG